MLRVIEGRGSGPEGLHKHPLSDNRSSLKPQSLNLFNVINPFLLITAAAATAVFIFISTRPQKSLVVEQTSLPAVVPEAEKQDKLKEYASQVADKDPFQTTQEEKVSAAAAPEAEIKLKLVGILSGGTKYAQAFIEIDGATHTCSEGETLLNGIKVEKIETDKVIVNQNGKTVTLQ